MKDLKKNKTNWQKERKELLKGLAKWDISSDERKMFRKFYFKSFRESVEFVNSVASFSERIKHYPGVVTLRITEVDIEIITDKKEGLSKKDLLLAKETEDIAGWKGSIEKWLSSPRVLFFLAILFALLIFWHYFL